MRNYLLILNVLNGIIFILVLIVFSNIFNFKKIMFKPNGDLVLFDVFETLKNVLIYVFYFCLYALSSVIGLMIAGMLSFLPSFNASFLFLFLDTFFKNFLGLWFAFPNKEIPSLGQIPELILEELLLFLNNIYLFAFQICYVIAILFFIRAILQTNPKYNLLAIGGLVMMIVLPLMVFGLIDMLDLFGFEIRYLEELENPVSTRLTNIPLDNFFLFLASPAALLAIVFYIYLEIAFQINYINTVTKPSLERSDRLEAQLDILKRESQLITANIDKIKEEAKKKKEQIEVEQEKVSKFFTKTSQRFSYVKEMIEKRKLEEEEKKLVTAASKTRRLGRYIDRLFREDKESENTLTAKSSAPKAQSLITSTVLNISFRLILLIVISFIIIHPHWFFVNVFNLPPAITESIEMYSPEVIITLLLPFILIFPVISYVISYIKQRNLVIRLKQEGRIKEILASVGDYVKKEEIKKEEKVESSNESGQIASETT
jgi:hypothetical protein